MDLLEGHVYDDAPSQLPHSLHGVPPSLIFPACSTSPDEDCPLSLLTPEFQSSLYQVDTLGNLLKAISQLPLSFLIRPALPDPQKTSRV